VSSPLTTICDVVRPGFASAVTVGFWNVCGVPVQATGTVVVVDVDVDVLVVELDVELEVDELVLVVDDVDVDELVDELVDVLDDVLVVVVTLVEVEVEEEVDVLVDELVDDEVEDDVVVVEKSQPMSVKRSRASDGSVRTVVKNGSIISFGLRAVSQCDTDEPPASDGGAYIRTWPPDTPPDRPPIWLRTWVPVQCRSPSFVADATRSALSIVDHISPVSWSSRNFM
jgi:hypothetical protein